VGRSVVFLNGPFGIGRSSTVGELSARLPLSLAFDPENVGQLVRRLLPRAADDYQGEPLWRRLVGDVAAHLLMEERVETVIIPMTVWRRSYFDELVEGLRLHATTRCFRLTASEQELRRRILPRPDEEGPHEWCLSHVPAGLALMSDPAFGDEIDTESMRPEEVVDNIVVRLALVDSRQQ